MNNLFTIPEAALHADNPERPEFFDAILTGARGLLVERIISHGHRTPEGEWYDQERDEWVAVLEGEAVLRFADRAKGPDGADGAEVALGRGDHVFLPKHCKHRVVYTSSPCIWLAVHADDLLPE